MKQKIVEYTLDFELFQKKLREKAMENSGSDPLDDMADVSEEILGFFKDLLEAGNTAELEKYSDAVLDESMELLYNSIPVLNYMTNYLEDDTILSCTDLPDQIMRRHLGTQRRLL